MKTCKKCNKPLINTGKFYLHPDNTDCQEEDGTRLEITDKFLFDKFQENYGKPEDTQAHITNLNTLITNQEELIRQQEELIFQNTFKQRLLRLFRKIFHPSHHKASKKESSK